MREVFNSDSMLMKTLSKLFDIGYLSIVFILFCIPVVTMGAALTALYYTTVKVIRRERGYVFQEFWRSFKLNFISATKMWIVELVIIVVMLFNITSVIEGTNEFSGFMLGTYIVMSLVIYGVSCYAYPVLSRFEMKNMAIIRMSLYLAAKYIYFTIPLIIISGVAIISVYYLMPVMPIVPILMPGLASLAYSFFMEIVLKKYTKNRESATNEHGEDSTEWYNE